MAVDFLPLCDLLFNFISVTTYFCDIAFDVIAAYTLYSQPDKLVWFCLLFVAIVVSILFCQVLSLKWFVEEVNEPPSKNRLNWIISIGVHFLLAGVLWRYARLLFVPIDIGLVKREMRNLSILRMIHAFFQCVISLMVQGYLLMSDDKDGSIGTNESMYLTSCSLSLVNICWAMASFNKNITQKTIHKLILTWIGVIFQFLWRLGTVGTRMLALILYSSVHHGWIFLFGFLHWLCMLVWLLFQKKSSSLKDFSPKFVFKSLVLSVIYMVDFINLEETSTKVRMALYYTIHFIENMLLVSLWSTHIKVTLVYTFEQRTKAYVLSIVPFFLGLIFMFIYYQFFHVNKTSQISKQEINSSRLKDSPDGVNKTVFNCALNPAMKKRKKIPRMIPPPPENKPFWKEPLPDKISNGTAAPSDTTVLDQHKLVSPDLIRKKLEEKRKKELEQLREIQTDPNQDLEDLRRQFYYQPRSSGYFTAKSMGHDSSGDQGDIDSNDDFDWTMPRHSSPFAANHVHHNLPEIVTSTNYKSLRHQRNGFKAETQL